MAGKKVMRSGKIPSALLEAILGASKLRRPTMLKSGKMGKGREMMKRNIVKEGRRFAGPKNPRGDFSGRSIEEQLRGGVGQLPQMDIKDQIMRRMGFPASEAVGAKAPPKPSFEEQMQPDIEGRLLETIMKHEMMAGAPPIEGKPVIPIPEGMAEDDMPETRTHNYVRAGGRQYPDYAREQMLPDYVGGTGYGPSRVGDPDFEAAKAEWMEINGREPATDSELMEVESMAATGDVSRNASESEVLRTVTGTRGSQGANAHGDDENLPPSDKMNGATLPATVDDVANADPAMVMEWLGGDLDAIQHLLPEEYWSAVESGDDDLEAQIEQDFISSNADLIFDLIHKGPTGR